VASDDAPASVKNMTSQIARAVFSVGKVPLSMWTGNAADHNVHAFAIGRDIDSGTRLTTLAETGLGALAVLKQYEPHKGGVRAITNGTGATGDGVSVAALTNFWPVETINGISEPLGNGGYNSGGTVALVLANHTAAGQFMVSYVSVGDAGTAVTNGAIELTFNGSTFSTSAVAEGNYTFWGYEHLYYLATIPTATKSIADAIATRLFNFDAPTPHFNDMAVSRKTDGAVVLPFF
jgi:ABC-type phosphate transport system substrate-binding protein